MHGITHSSVMYREFCPSLVAQQILLGSPLSPKFGLVSWMELDLNHGDGENGHSV